MGRLLAWFKKSILAQYFLYLMVAGTISLILSGLYIGPVRLQLQRDTIRPLAELAMIPNTKNPNEPPLQRLKRFITNNGIMVWQVDSTGGILAYTDPLPLPAPWDGFPLPEEAGSITEGTKTRHGDLFIFRLADKTPTFLVFLFTGSVYIKAIGTYILGLALWFVIVAMVGARFLLRKARYA